MLLNTADAIYVGDVAADRVYLGDLLVWEPSAPEPSGPRVVFSGGGIESTLLTAVITIPAGTAVSTTLFLMKNQTGGITSISDPNVKLVATTNLPGANRMFVYDCDTAGKSFTITWNTNSNASWAVVGMDAPRIGAAATGASDTTSVITGATLAVPSQAGDVAVGWYSANNTVNVWTTPAFAQVLRSQVAAGARVHAVCGVTAHLAAAPSTVLGDADRGLAGTGRVEQSAVALFRSAAPT